MIFVLVPAAILCALYFTFMFKRAIKVWFKNVSKAVENTVAISISILFTLPMLFFSTWEIVVLYMFLVSLLCDLIRLIVHLATKNRPPAGQTAKRILKNGLIPIIATLLIVSFGVWNMNTIYRTDYTVKTTKALPNGGYTIALISDLHFGVSMNLEKLQKYCNDIEQTKPDMLVLCGDIVDESTTYENMTAVFEVFGKCKSKFGTFYVYGNHDRAAYASKPNFTPEQLAETIKSNGIKILQDSSMDLDEHLFVVGREDVGISHSLPFKKGFERAKTADLMKNADKNKFVLMLDHQPVMYEENEKAGVDLQLSGHTHNGQIFPLKHIMQPFDKNELHYGKKKIGQLTAIVSSGMAGWGFNIRTWGISEYVIIHVEN